MKNFYCSILFCLFFVVQTSSQTFFPLDVENLWQYGSNDIMNPPYLSSLITEQVTMPNGKLYSHFSYFPFEKKDFRQQDSIVYAYFSNDTSEHVLFNFTALPGDTISRFYSPNHRTEARIIFESKGFDIGYNRQVWKFFLDIGYVFVTWTIADSLGLVSFLGEPGLRYGAYGIRIDGLVKYGFITSVDHQSKSPIQLFELYQNYPNPFNPTTTIRYSLPKSSFVKLTIYNTLGQKIRTLKDSYQSAGEHSLVWDAQDERNNPVSSGMYFYSFQTDEMTLQKKMILVR